MTLGDGIIIRIIAGGLTVHLVQLNETKLALSRLRSWRVAAQSKQAQAFRAETPRRHGAAKATWRSSDLPVWLNKDTYIREIQPKLKAVTLSALASALGISIPYAVSVRNGKCVPHPRHWKKLAVLANATPDN